jgi:hypothetical protein
MLASAVLRAAELAGDIGRAVLAGLHGPRRPRVCARRVKSPLSRWNKHPEGKPCTSKRIMAVTSSVIPALPADGNARAGAPGRPEGPQSPDQTEGTGTPGETGARRSRPRETAGTRHAPQAGTHAGTAGPDPATLRTGKTAHAHGWH